MVTLSTHTYRNGRFGNNTAWLARTPYGYAVGNGYNDPFAYGSLRLALTAWGRVLKRVSR